MNPLGNVKHGHHGSITYMRWKSMLQRCTNPRASNYMHYGANGISVCERWRLSFADFLADMGECPNRAMTLDRIDGTRNYEPGNCRWATRAQQTLNRSMNVPLTHAGRTLLVSEWAAVLGISANTLRQRLYLGWSVEKTLSTPKARRGRQR